MTALKIYKVLNNNAAIIKEDGQEKIVMGPGIAFQKGAVLLNAVMPVRENQMKVTAFAGGTYQAADAYQAGGFSEKREEKTERMSGCKRMKPGSYTTEPSRAVR
ncbi:hypothetical protein DT075_00870 [Bacillus licheniformis]|nr:hypothetical protein DT075_00870 [Bacillus licheniformis]